MEFKEIRTNTFKELIVYSIIIPVFNSEKIVTETVTRTLSFLTQNNLTGEIILINDGSSDRSWEVIKRMAEQNSNVLAIDLLKNYGQHTAILCGIKEASGDFLITMDDDLQNPPEEIIKLINKISEGYDVVFAKFASKKHQNYRRIGTKIVDYLNQKIFNKPKSLRLTNFRIFNRDVANRVADYKTFYPYIPGLLLMFSSKLANVTTEHKSRKVGTSNYNLVKITKLVARILFNYSNFPLTLLTFTGFAVSLISFIAGISFIIKDVFFGTQVRGWTTIVVLLSFFNGFLIIMVGVLGQYVARLMKQLSVIESYSIREVAP